MHPLHGFSKGSWIWEPQASVSGMCHHAAGQIRGAAKPLAGSGQNLHGLRQVAVGGGCGGQGVSLGVGVDSPDSKYSCSQFTCGCSPPSVPSPPQPLTPR